MNREYYESFEWFWDKQTDKKENKMIEEMKKLKEIMNEHLSHWEFEDEMQKSWIARNYVEQFGVEDIEAFIKFCKKNDMENKITPTLAHDINGTFDEMFLPRTSGYHKRTKEA